jgi:hypothetical protein
MEDQEVKLRSGVHWYWSVAADPSSVQVEICWSEGTKTGTEDALDLARRCVGAWDAYLERHGLQSPI